MSTAIVYVQLGDNPSKTLLSFAKNAQNLLEYSNSILITDVPEKWLDFPGELVDISNFQYAQGYSRFEKANRELKKIAGGYWLNTLKRLFALEILSNHPSITGDIVHFESDVFSLLTTSTVEVLRKNVKTAAIPRFSDQRGIASILYIRDKTEIRILIEKLSLLLQNNLDIKDDMELLGFALNENKIQELPSLPSDAWQYKGQNYIFDGAAYGQYLFGQDPFHTSGKIISGYKNPDFKFDVISAKWKINQSDAKENLSFHFQGTEYILSNVHVHSKIPLGPLSESNQIWTTYLSEANGETHRSIVTESEPSIHSGKLPLLTKLILAKKKGLLRSIISKILRTINT